MRISDWSSDVCSSDLLELALRLEGERLGAQRGKARIVVWAAAGKALRGGDAREAARRRKRAALRAADHLGARRRADDGIVADALAGRPVVEDHGVADGVVGARSEEHTSELQSLMRSSYA